jgi:hypothetical protein
MEIPRTDLGKIALSTFSPGGDRNKNFPISLAPGEVDSTYEKYNLKDHFIFNKSGAYNVVYLYDEIYGKAEVRVESNTLRIQISK